MDNFQVYKSSAGSGKTFTIVKEFLKWCFRSNSCSYYSNILAITFTNKATLEMKERVIETLLNAANPNSSFNNLNNKIQEELQLSDSKQRELSTKMLTDILHNYGDFSISTIDKFSHKLVRTFAHDLRIPLNFKVELDLREVLQNVVNSFIDTVGKNEKYDQWVYDFSFSKLEDNKSWKVENELVSLMNSLLQEKNRRFLEDLKDEKSVDFIKLYNSYKNENELIFKEVETIGKKALNLIHSNGLNPTDFYQGSKGLYSYFLKKRNEKQFLITANKFTLETINEDKWASGKLKGTEMEGVLHSIGKQLKEYFNAIEEILEIKKSDYIIRRSIYRNLHTVALQQELAKQLEAFKKQLNFINMLDVNHKIAEVVLTEPMPFVYERLGERYNHIMIDEFQDTSPLQFANLLPLIEEGLSKGNESMLVGDAKQAIYRFRGGDYRQLSEMPNLNFESFKEKELIEMRLDSLKANYKEETLNINYRSKQKIVEFNNLIFEFVTNSAFINEETKEIYQDVKQFANDKSGEGFVQLDLVDNEEDSIYDCLLNNIQQCLEDGYKLNEIAILTQKNDQSSQIAKFLSSKEIKVISSEALCISNSEEVGFLLNMMAIINNHKNTIAFIKVVRYLTIIRSQILINTYTELKDFDSLNWYFKKEYSIDLLLLNHLPLVHMVEELVRAMKFEKKYNVYIQFFQDIVFDYSIQEGNNVELFLSHWEEKAENFSLDIPEDTDAINLMTVHRSKGLEFEVVLFPFSNISKGNYKTLKWIDKLPPHKTNAKIGVIEIGKELLETKIASIKIVEDQEEEIDLLNRIYVAFTRASERLYIQSKEVKQNSKSEQKLTIDNLLHDFINQSIGLSKDGDFKFTFGKRSIKNHTLELRTDSNKLDLEYISFPAYQNLNFAIEGSFQNESIVKGNIVHEVFYTMNSTADLFPSLKKAKRKFKQFKKWQELEQELVLLINQQSFIEIFDGSENIIKEKEIMDDNGNIFRPDRVVEKNGKDILVDFKTGKKDSAHLSQIKKYAHLMQSLSSRPVEAYLVYTEEISIQKVA